MTKLEDAFKKLQAGHTAGTLPQRLVDPRVPKLQLERDVPTELASGILRSASSLVVSLDADRLRSLGYIGSNDDERLLADQYRQIKRPLLQSALDPRGAGLVDGNFVQLTSAIANEGKTFTCLNLALSVAQEKDVSVLLIDADVVSPRLTMTLGLEEKLGLLDFLSDDNLGIEDVIYHTSRPSLLCMPAGRPRPNTAELLASARMEDLVAQAARRYRGQIVLADSSPVTLTSESRVLAARAGQVVLVVRAGSTPRGAVLQAIEALGEEKPLNLVLNGVSSRSFEEPYGGYGYGSAASHPLLAEVDDQPGRQP
jgi:protein-tyrosine kinase